MGVVSGREAPSVETVGRWRRPVGWLAWPIHKLWLDVRLDDAGNVPDAGGVILAANHLSFLDSLLLMFCLPRPVSFMGKAEYLDGALTKRVFPAAGMIPVDRSGRGVRESLRQASARLDAGEIVGIFPEGTRSRDGHLHPGHPGAAHLALRTGAPIVPVGIIGSDRVQPPDARIPTFRGRIELRFGSPIDLGPWAGSRPTGTTRREITAEVMRAIASLSGQSLAPRVREAEQVCDQIGDGRPVPAG